MDKKSKIFFIIFGLLIAVMIGATYWRIMVKKDYVVEAQTDCDPYVEQCFLWECDPESDVDGEKCTGDPEEDSWYFQVIKRNASRIPLCDSATDENCEALVCGENEPECEYEFCTEENMEDQYASACNDPMKYTEENPVEEESIECEEGDTECESAQQDEDSESADAEIPDSDDTESQSE